MLFEWDEAKRQANLAKHLIDFADAVRIFDGPVFEKMQRRQDENRVLTVGLLKDVQIVVITPCADSTAGLFRPGGPIAMKGKITRTNSKQRTSGGTNLKRLRTMPDASIDYSDIPRLNKSFWKTARLTMPEPKDRLTIRVDHDVVEWLKKHGRGYQTRINAILRSYMEAQLGG
jgi:uncharacterized protein (DUF4415 family)/uncharacterized DUF497 family protein